MFFLLCATHCPIHQAYHFVVYLPVAGALYELDGLKEFAVRHGGWESYSVGGEGGLAKAREVIGNRIRTYPSGAVSCPSRLCDPFSNFKFGDLRPSIRLLLHCPIIFIIS